ncbi:MAG: hypothetical protein ACLSGB_05105 [Dorea sp.]|uniref:hypothetical protein n=1 Tax=Dorea sp. TaxID=2040332 RepID=UPI003991B5EA
MEKLIETRGQYNAIRSRVLANVWTIENVRDLLGRSCIKEEYEKYVRTLYALKKLFTFSKCEKEEEFNRLFNDGFGFKDEETKKLARKYVEERKKELEEEERKAAESIAFK